MGIKFAAGLVGLAIGATALFGGYHIDIDPKEGLKITRPKYAVEQGSDLMRGEIGTQRDHFERPTFHGGYITGEKFKERPRAEEFDKARGRYYSSKRWMGS